MKKIKILSDNVSLRDDYQLKPIQGFIDDTWEIEFLVAHLPRFSSSFWQLFPRIPLLDKHLKIGLYCDSLFEFYGCEFYDLIYFISIF